MYLRFHDTCVLSLLRNTYQEHNDDRRHQAATTPDLPHYGPAPRTRIREAYYKACEGLQTMANERELADDADLLPIRRRHYSTYTCMPAKHSMPCVIVGSAQFYSPRAI